MCSETSSPRLSFSYNLPEDGSVPIEHKRQDITTLLDLEFEFNINLENECSSADELFSNGLIVPIKVHHPPFTASLPPLPPIENSKKITLMVENSNNSDQLEQRVSESKSFWGFKRSSSLNFETKRSSLCPLPLLSRSNSTGSLPNLKSKKSKEHSQKQTSHKHHSNSMRKSSSSPSSSSNQCSTNVKPQMCKNQGGVYGNYQYIGTVLNVPPKFFGFGSLLRCGMDKKSKK